MEDNTLFMSDLLEFLKQASERTLIKLDSLKLDKDSICMEYCGCWIHLELIDSFLVDVFSLDDIQFKKRRVVSVAEPNIDYKEKVVKYANDKCWSKINQNIAYSMSLTNEGYAKSIFSLVQEFIDEFPALP